MCLNEIALHSQNVLSILELIVVDINGRIYNTWPSYGSL